MRKTLSIILLIASIAGVVIALLFVVATAYQFAKGGYFALPRLPVNEWQALATILYGVLGISAGMYYFHARIKLDESLNKNERRRSRLMHLLELLTQAQGLVYQILAKHVHTDSDLSGIRARLNALMFSIATYIEVHVDFLGLEDSERRPILRVHSYTEQTRSISSLRAEELKAADVSGDLNGYIELSQAAQTICLTNAESI